MNARDRVDAQVRRLARVTDERMSAVAGAEAREGLLEGIVDMPVPTSATPSRRRLRPALVAGVVAATVGATAAGYALVTSSARDTTALQCNLEDGPAIIPATSGDPVVDCAAEWERITGKPAPPLVAYENGHGGIAVGDARLPLPEGATPLAPGAGQNVALIELQEALDDHVAGLKSRCFGPADATRFAGQQLARLDLSGWNVRHSDEGRSCVGTAIVDPATRTVSLRSDSELDDPAQPYVKLAAKLRDVADECLPLPAMAARVEAAAKQAGLGGETPQYKLTKVETSAGCTSVRQTVGGTIFITLRGPKG